ncbi:MAG: cell wall-associated NlpC family hydrolase [Sphingobacteriales bacterium]|jgi:cell wall-associated NlpC family hydrolase
MIQEYGICHLSAAPLRLEPSDKSEQISQLIFGESVRILDRKENWILVQNLLDGYEGWMDPKQLISLDKKPARSLKSTVFATSMDAKVEKTDGEWFPINPGSELFDFNGGTFNVAQKKYNFRGRAAAPNSINAKAKVEEYSRLYLGAPYQWGGRALMGIDCSGFVQNVFKMLGVAMKRDAFQQAEQGDLVNFFEEAVVGDLAFFDNEEGRIIHVGIILPNNKVIHAAGEVRIDSLDHQGIFNAEMKKYSHKLRIIRRVI